MNESILPSIGRSVRPSIHASFHHSTFLHPNIHSSFHPSIRSIHPSIHPSIYLSIHYYYIELNLWKMFTLFFASLPFLSNVLWITVQEVIGILRWRRGLKVRNSLTV